MLPGHLPDAVRKTRPVSSETAISHTKQAFLWSPAAVASFLNNFSVFSASEAFSPANLADRTPGIPLRNGTSNPESSASTHRLVERAYAEAFSAAFSAKVAPVSFTIGRSEKSAKDVKMNGRSASDLSISSSFPGFVVPMTSSRIICLIKTEWVDRQRTGKGISHWKKLPNPPGSRYKLIGGD